MKRNLCARLVNGMLFEAEILDAIKRGLQIEDQEIGNLLETPPKPEMGDFAVPCFRLSKVLRQSPQSIAQRIQELDLPACIRRVEVVGGYANLFVDHAAAAALIIKKVLQEGPDYGKNDIGKGRKVCIDYSSINIAKPFHIGHLSSTAIGHALYNIYNFCGYQSVGINHLGDWGTQFGKLLCAYEMWGDKQEILDGGVNAMLKLYVRFHEEAEKDDRLNDRARAWFKRIEDGDPEATELFHMFKDLTIREVMRVYDMLGIRFDSYAGESFYNDKMQSVIDELEQKHLLIESEGAKVVDLSQFDMTPCLILRSDGATLYATRDIAAAIYRKQHYDFAKSLYVVAYQQNLHFRKIFKVIELMGYEWSKDLEHVAFGMVSLEGETLSTRKGNVVLLEDVLKSATDRAKQIIKEKSPNLEDPDRVANQVGIGAVVFSVLYHSRIKDISFSYDRVLSFDGETAPYVQYTHARCNSVKNKGMHLAAKEADYSALDNEYAWHVARLCGEFPDAIVEAMEKNEPYLLTRQVMEIAKAYNRFYYEIRIVDEEDPAGSLARLQLTDAVRTILHTGLGLLGIAAPERM